MGSRKTPRKQRVSHQNAIPEMTLLSLPPELILNIADELRTWNLNYLVQTCRSLHFTLNDYLYRKDAKDGAWSLFWACMEDSVETARLALSNGADPLGICIPSLQGEIYPTALCSFEMTQVTPLATALLSSSASVANLLIEMGVELQGEVAQSGFRPFNVVNSLHIASAARMASTVRLLIQRSVQPNSVDTEGQTALHYTIDAADQASWTEKEPSLVSIVRILIENGVDVDKRCNYGLTALHLATGIDALYPQSNTTDLVPAICLMVENTRDVNITDNLGQTALHMAVTNNSWVQCGDPSQIKFVMTRLLKKGANVNARDLDGKTPLHRLLEFGRKSLHGGDRDYQAELLVSLISRFLISNGADTDALDNCRLSPLTYALKSDRKIMGRISAFPEIALELLDRGAKATGVDEDGQTLLHLVSVLPIRSGSEKEEQTRRLMSALAERGIDLNATNRRGQTALHLALGHLFDPFKALILVEMGADVDMNDTEGITPMHLVFQWSQARGIREERYEQLSSLMIQRSKDVNARDRIGQTPLHSYASKARGSLGTLAILLEAGADINAQQNDGETPLHIILRQVIQDGRVTIPGEREERVQMALKILEYNPIYVFKDRKGLPIDLSKFRRREPKLNRQLVMAMNRVAEYHTSVAKQKPQEQEQKQDRNPPSKPNIHQMKLRKR